MTATVINKYRILCQTEGVQVYVWSDTSPTTCPNNTGHTIDTSSISIVNTVSKNIVKIQEEVVQTGGHYRMATCGLTCAGLSAVTSQVFTFPYPISLMAGSILTTSANTGDVMNIEAGNNTSVGTITSDTSTLSTVISVSSTVITNVAVGHYVRLTNGVSTSSSILVLATDKINSTITLQSAIGIVFLASSPTYVQLRVVVCQDLEFGNAGKYVIGKRTIKGAYIPAGFPFLVTYMNAGLTSKRIVLHIEYLY